MYRSLTPYYEVLFPLNPGAAAFVRSHAPENCHRVLDVGCGTGAMARHLAPRYDRVVGLDPDPDVIDEAIRLAEAAGRNARFHVAGMSEMAAAAEDTPWDMILCMGNTLPHLVRRDQQRHFLQNARNVLRRTGRMMIQTVNFDKICLSDPYEFPVLKRRDLDFHRTYRSTDLPDIIQFETRLELPQGPPVTGHTELGVLKRTTLESVLVETGFHVLGCFGDYAGGTWSENSPATILLAEVS